VTRVTSARKSPLRRHSRESRNQSSRESRPALREESMSSAVAQGGGNGHLSCHLSPFRYQLQLTDIKSSTYLLNLKYYFNFFWPQCCGLPKTRQNACFRSKIGFVLGFVPNGLPSFSTTWWLRTSLFNIFFAALCFAAEKHPPCRAEQSPAPYGAGRSEASRLGCSPA
jgi:hypothetical protein